MTIERHLSTWVLTPGRRGAIRRVFQDRRRVRGPNQAHCCGCKTKAPVRANLSNDGPCKKTYQPGAWPCAGLSRVVNTTRLSGLCTRHNGRAGGGPDAKRLTRRRLLHIRKSPFWGHFPTQNNRGVAQPGKSPRPGTGWSHVQIMPPRPTGERHGRRVEAPGFPG